MRRCPNCGAENPDDARFCNLCFDVLGFDDPEYIVANKDTEGFLTEYPSSFRIEDEAKSTFAGKAPSEAYDIGGISSSDDKEYRSRVVYEAGVVTHPEGDYRGIVSANRYVPKISLEKVFRNCVTIAFIALTVSLLLEWLLSALGLGALLRGEITLSRAYFLISLVIPAVICGYLSGYRLQRYGWLFGTITVLVWSVVFRPIAYGVIRWLFTGSFDLMVPLSAANLVVIVCLFLPAAGISGWLGEKRATSGLAI